MAAEVKAGPVSAPVIPLLLLGLGGYLMWFGAKYWRKDVRWPSDPIKAVLQGKGLPDPAPAAPVQANLTAEVSKAQAAVAAPGSAQTGTAAAGGGAYQGTVSAGSAQNTAQLLLTKYGWDLSQMASLIKLWTQESGWSPTARNASGAFGIAQALGHGDAGSAAPDGTNEYGAQYGLTEAEAQAANSGNARWQIEWGLGYIRDRYGSPDSAWAHEQGFNWY